MKKLISVMLLLGWSIEVSAITIDFEEFSTGSVAPSFESRGFVFSDASGSGDIAVDRCLWNCDGMKITAGLSSALAMEHLDGKSFHLDSFEFYGVQLDNSLVELSGNARFDITGFYAGGGSVQMQYFVDTGYEQDLFVGDEWTGLDRVEFGIASFNVSCHVCTPSNLEFSLIDNISASVVPIPAAVWLFGSGLGLLGWIRRR